MVALLLVLFGASLYGEKIPINNGAGFDGEFYRSVAQNFSADFWNSGYDAFRIQRLFPFLGVHYVFQILGVSATDENLMSAMFGLHLFNLLLQIALFFAISKILRWQPATEMVLFAVLFLNFFTLKNCGYEPFQTDAFAITLSLLGVYFYLKNKVLCNGIVAILGMITWPLVTLQILLLMALDKPFSQSETGWKVDMGKIFPILYGTFAALSITALCVAGHLGIVRNLLMREANLPLTVFSFCSILVALYFLLRQVPRLPLDFWISAKNCRWKVLGGFLAVWLIVKYFLFLHTNDEFFSSNSIFGLQILLRPLKYPLISFVGFVAFYGILPMLILFGFRDFSRDFIDRSAGFACLFGAFLVLMLDSESRHLASLLPVLLLPLGTVLDKWDLGKFQVAALVILQLLLSHFYFPINTENLLGQLQTGNFELPAAQRYFMNFGAYMSLKSYFLWSAVSVALIIVSCGILKKPFFTKDNSGLAGRKEGTPWRKISRRN